MAEFAVKVVEITKPVEDHPNADRLSLVYINDFICISAKMEDGSHRYKVGDRVIYVPEAALVPEYLLRLGFWNDKTDKGGLAGADGNRVKAMKLRGIFSQGIMFPVENGTITNGDGVSKTVEVGEDVAEFMGIEKYEPEIPAHMAGEVANLFGHTMKYDVENIQNMPDIFDILPLSDSSVVATEKLHGTNCQIGFVSGLNHPEMFGENGEIFVGSKGMTSRGLVFKNNEANDHNIYVSLMRDLLASGFEEKIKALLSDAWICIAGPNPTIHIFGEIFGPGVQDLTYGVKKRTFRIFDIAVNGEFVGYDRFKIIAERLELDTTPVLYHGNFSTDGLKAVRDGMDSFSGTHIREGIVIRSANEMTHPIHGRLSVKWVSPDYLLRKGNATEYS